MLAVIGSRWWLFLLRGIAAIIFGALAFVWPGITLLALVTVFAIYAFIGGIFAVWTAFFGDDTHSRWLLFFEGLLGIVAGLIVWNYPLMSALAFVYFFAAFAIITGIAQILFGVQMRDVIKDEWLYILSGAVSIIFGVLVLRDPTSGALAEIWIIGTYAILIGILWVALSFRLKSLHDKLTPKAA